MQLNTKSLDNKVRNILDEIIIMFSNGSINYSSYEHNLFNILKNSGVVTLNPSKGFSENNYFTFLTYFFANKLHLHPRDGLHGTYVSLPSQPLSKEHQEDVNNYNELIYQ